MMGANEYEEGIARVRAILAGITTTKPSSDVVVTKTLFAALSVVYEEAETVEGSVLVANANLAALEDVCSGKCVLLSRCLQTLVISIYSCIVAKSPGYAVRNIASTYLTLSANKTAPSCSRECSLNILGLIFATRAYDCGSLISDTAAGLSKLAKGSDLRLRIASLKALFSMVSGAGSRMVDCHSDLAKLAGKCATDRSVEIRLTSATLLTAIARTSSGCTSVSAETLLGAVGKGLEDEVAVAQDGFCRAVAAVFSEQIRAQLDSEEQLKIGLARGVSSPAEPIPKPKRKLISKIASAMKSAIEEKKTVEDYRFRSVVAHILKQVVKASTTNVRAAHVAVLSYLVKDCVSLDQLDGQVDVDWLVESMLGLLRDSSFNAQSYEDQMFFRARLSHLVRTAVTSQLSEGRLTALATFLTQYVARMDIDSDTRSFEQELQFALGELSHMVTCLGEAAASVADIVQAAATVHLRHPVFGVRSSAAYVLSSLAATLPGSAPVNLRASLSSAHLQARQLSAFDGTDNNPNGKASREQERLQRMYFFHGHTMVLSIFLRNEKHLATGLPKQLVLDILDFGLELLQQDVLNSSVGVRHIRCSLVRAGSLILSSSLSTGHQVARLRLTEIVKSCSSLFKTTLAPALSDELMMYELMCIEAALVCIATLLWAAPEVFIQDSDTLPLVIDGLETTLRAAKGKYYPKFKSHFRFRTLHSILLECFAWLPPGSFAHCPSMQPLFVEALRVLRDGVAHGHEGTCLVKTDIEAFDAFLPPTKPTARQAAAVAASMDDLYQSLPLSDLAILNISSSSTSARALTHPASTSAPSWFSFACMELPLNESCLMLKLEAAAVALDKKESEAFLASFGSEGMSGGSRFVAEYPTVRWVQTATPSVSTDARAVNAAILLLASTFGYQSIEYQEKAMLFFSQTMMTVTGALAKGGQSSTMSTGMSSVFSGSGQEEERRRKERKGCAVIGLVLASLSAIVASLPCTRGETLVTVWGQVLIDRLCDLLAHSNSDIRSTAANTLATFCFICSGGGHGGAREGVSGCCDFIEFDGNQSSDSLADLDVSWEREREGEGGEVSVGGGGGGGEVVRAGCSPDTARTSDETAEVAWLIQVGTLPLRDTFCDPSQDTFQGRF